LSVACVGTRWVLPRGSALQARALHGGKVRAARQERDVGAAFASAAPNPPPTPPAPTTAIRIESAPQLEGLPNSRVQNASMSARNNSASPG